MRHAKLVYILFIANLIIFVHQSMLYIIQLPEALSLIACHSVHAHL